MRVLFCTGNDIRTGFFIPNYNDEYIECKYVFKGDDKTVFNSDVRIHWMPLPESIRIIEYKLRDKEK